VRGQQVAQLLPRLLPPHSLRRGAGGGSQAPLPSLASSVDAEPFRSQEALADGGSDSAPPPSPAATAKIRLCGGTGVIADTPFLQFSKTVQVVQFWNIYLHLIKFFSELQL